MSEVTDFRSLALQGVAALRKNESQLDAYNPDHVVARALLQFVSADSDPLASIFNIAAFTRENRAEEIVLLGEDYWQSIHSLTQAMLAELEIE